MIYYAHNIRQLRKEKGFTQSKLAENITSQGVISKIEKEIISPDIKTLQAIADKLNISLHDLLFESTEKNMLQQFYSQVNILLISETIQDLSHLLLTIHFSKLLSKTIPASTIGLQGLLTFVCMIKLTKVFLTLSKV